MKCCLLVLALSCGMAASVGGGSVADRSCAEIRQEIDIKNTQLAALTTEIGISKANRPFDHCTWIMVQSARC